MGGPEDPLRVLLSVHHQVGDGGGAGGSTLALADALTARGHDVRLVGFGLLRRSRGGTLDAIAYPHALASELRRTLDEAALDVVDASTGDLAYMGRGRITASSCAFFTRSHGLEHLAARRRRAGARAGELELRARYRAYHGGLRLREVARSLRIADGVLLLNDAEEAFATGALRIPASKVWRTAPVAPPLPPPRPGSPRGVLVLGPCSWRKGGDVALRVLEHLLRADGALTASWHGLDDPEELSARLPSELRARLECSGRYGRQELADLLASHDVLLVASRSEGLPVTLLEAVSAGMACVGSDVPGIADVLAGGVGVLVPEGHVDGLVGAVRRLLCDPAARRAHAVAARESSTRWDPGRVVDDLVRAYREVLAIKRPGR